MSNNFDKVKENRERTQLIHDFLEQAGMSGMEMAKLFDPEAKAEIREHCEFNPRFYIENQFIKIGPHQAMGMIIDNAADFADAFSHEQEGHIIDFLKFQRDRGVWLVWRLDKTVAPNYVIQNPKLDDMLYEWIGVNGKRFEREKEKKLRSLLAEARQGQEKNDEQPAGGATGSDE